MEISCRKPRHSIKENAITITTCDSFTSVALDEVIYMREKKVIIVTTALKKINRKKYVIINS